MDLLKTLLDNGSVNMFQHATMEAVFSIASTLTLSSVQLSVGVTHGKSVAEEESEVKL
jgi:hypothetical protein